MPFPPWQTVPHSATLHDLLSTSLLIQDQGATSGILLRCSAGLEPGSVIILMATTGRPNVLGMMDVDGETHIGDEARALLRSSHANVLAVPHITWKSWGQGLPWRTPIAAAVGVLAAVLMYVPPLSWNPWAVVPLAAVMGVVVWLLLRERLPTTIGPPETAPMTVSDVVRRAIGCAGSASHVPSSDPGLPKESRRWVPVR